MVWSILVRSHQGGMSGVQSKGMEGYFPIRLRILFYGSSTDNGGALY